MILLNGVLKFNAMTKNKGFTLIELVVAISIVSFLSSIVLSVLGDTRAKTSDSVRLQEINTLIQAIQRYHLDNDAFPGILDGSGVHVSSSCTSDLVTDLQGDGYISVIPTDPKDAACTDNDDAAYFYGWDSSRCEEYYCLSINRFEAGINSPIAEQLRVKYASFGVQEQVSGKMQDQTCGSQANISDADFNICFEYDL